MTIVTADADKFLVGIARENFAKALGEETSVSVSQIEDQTIPNCRDLNVECARLVLDKPGSCDDQLEHLCRMVGIVSTPALLDRLRTTLAPLAQAATKYIVHVHGGRLRVTMQVFRCAVN